MMSINLNNFKTWYGGINLNKLESYVDNIISTHQIYKLSLKEKCYIVMKNYKELLNILDEDIRQNIIRKNNTIINTYNDKTLFIINDEYKTIRKLIKNKRLEMIIKKYYPEYEITEEELSNNENKL